MASPSVTAPESDRAVLLKAFDEPHTGLYGLMSAVSTVPYLFFHLSPAHRPAYTHGVSIPVLDLYLPAPSAIASAAAAQGWSFFHVVSGM